MSLPTPTTAVVGQGRIDVTLGAVVSGRWTRSGSRDQVWELLPATFTAVPAAGWQFVRFEVTSDFSSDFVDGSSTVEQLSDQAAINPIALRSGDDGSAPVNWYWSGYIGAWHYDPPAASGVLGAHHVTYHVTAVFEEIPAPPATRIVLSILPGPNAHGLSSHGSVRWTLRDALGNETSGVESNRREFTVEQGGRLTLLPQAAPGCEFRAWLNEGNVETVQPLVKSGASYGDEGEVECWFGCGAILEEGGTILRDDARLGFPLRC